VKLRAGPRSWWPRTRTARGGSVLIPAFAVGRTQEFLYHLNSLGRAGRLHDRLGDLGVRPHPRGHGRKKEDQGLRERVHETRT